MKKQYGLMHIPDLTADETRLPAWYLAAEVDARIADLESALCELLQDTQHINHNCGDGPDRCPVARARELIGL